jgi:hypothetical protein
MIIRTPLNQHLLTFSLFIKIFYYHKNLNNYVIKCMPQNSCILKIQITISITLLTDLRYILYNNSTNSVFGFYKNLRR